MSICIGKYMHFYVFTFDNIRVFQRVCACVYVRASMHITVLISYAFEIVNELHVK